MPLLKISEKKLIFCIGSTDLGSIVWSVVGFGLALESCYAPNFCNISFVCSLKTPQGKRSFLTKLSERNLDPVKVNGSSATEFTEINVAPQGL